MANRFDYVAYDQMARDKQETLKNKFMELEFLMSELLPTGRPQSLAFTNLEESYMWIGKSLRDEQIERNGSAPLQEDRKNG